MEMTLSISKKKYERLFKRYNIEVPELTKEQVEENERRYNDYKIRISGLDYMDRGYVYFTFPHIRESFEQWMRRTMVDGLIVDFSKLEIRI